MLSWSAIRRMLASVIPKHADRRFSTRVVDGAPGPSPWYLRTCNPRVPGYEWSAAGESGQAAGATVLTGGDGPVLILDFHNHVLLLEPDTLLIWHQGADESGLTPPVVLRIFRLSTLSRLEGNMNELCGAMRRAKASFVASAPPQWELPIPTTVIGERPSLTFPPPLRHIEELLILCHSSAIEPSSSAERGNLALLIARPRAGTYEFYPQDWFNNAGLDYSYQWVTRVARDPESHRIHGEGVRISPFVLDDTLRRIL
jgi:hypothetical protein